MVTKIIIPENSKAAEVLRQLEVDKEAFRQAVLSGRGKEYAKQHASKTITRLSR
jgi:hypothetical protein